MTRPRMTITSRSPSEIRKNPMPMYTRISCTTRPSTSPVRLRNQPNRERAVRVRRPRSTLGRRPPPAAGPCAAFMPHLQRRATVLVSFSGSPRLSRGRVRRLRLTRRFPLTVVRLRSPRVAVCSRDALRQTCPLDVSVRTASTSTSSAMRNDRGMRSGLPAVRLSKLDSGPWPFSRAPTAESATCDREERARCDDDG